MPTQPPPYVRPSDAEVEAFLASHAATPDMVFLMAAYLAFAHQPLDPEDITVDAGRLGNKTPRRAIIEDLLNGVYAVPPRTAQATGDARRNYQEVWVKGASLEAGTRECAARYAFIRAFCAQYERPFTVLDIGANLGYFSVRLAEDFNCTVVAAEGFFTRPLFQVLRLNQCDRAIMLNHVFTLETLRQLAEVEHFDVVLGMSILHHLTGGPVPELFDALLSLGDHLILELPVEESINVKGNLLDTVHLQLPPHATLLGRGQSHLSEGQRPIYHIAQPKRALLRAHLDAPPHLSGIRIESDFQHKMVQVGDKPPRPWIPGINQRTYARMDGYFPTLMHMAMATRTQDLDAATAAGNVIVSGKKLTAL